MALPNPYSIRLKQFSSFVFEEKELENCSSQHQSNWPNSWVGFFKSKNPKKFALEIGSSSGVFLNALGKSDPNMALIGVDWKFKMLFKAADQAFKNQISNIAYIRGKAENIDKYFNDIVFDEVFVFFPDPWVKSSQKKHRLIQEKFLLLLSKYLKKNSRVFIKTDHPGYFQWVLAIFDQSDIDLPSYSTNSSSKEQSYKDKQTKARKAYSSTELAPKSKDVLELYKIGISSKNFWSEELDVPNYLKEFPTQFEKHFLKEKLPIYFIEIIKK